MQRVLYRDVLIRVVWRVHRLLLWQLLKVVPEATASVHIQEEMFAQNCWSDGEWRQEKDGKCAFTKGCGAWKRQQIEQSSLSHRKGWCLEEAARAIIVTTGVVPGKGS